MSPNFVDTFDFKKVIIELVVRLTYSITQKCLVWLGIILKIAWKITKEVLNSLEIFYSKVDSWAKFNEKQGGFLIKFQDLEMGHIKSGVF